MPFVHFAFQPGGRRAGAGSTHTPIYSKRKHWMTGNPELDTRTPGKVPNEDTISLYFNPTYYKWVMEMRQNPAIPKPLNGIFYVSPTLPENCLQTNRY